MSKSATSTKAQRVQKVCTLWTHDDNFSRDDVVFNGEKFPELPATPGSLIQIIALKHGTAVRDFQTPTKTLPNEKHQAKAHGSSNDAVSQAPLRRSRRGSAMITLDENGSVIHGGRDVDPEKSYIFVARPLPADMKAKHTNLQVSIAEKIAKVFGFRNRMQVIMTQADEEKHSASHVEIAFRDEYLTRADMWRMSISELSSRTVYRGQKLLFMGTIKATIKNVYINGQSNHSGYFSSVTKPVFRSESSRYVLFIQMSKEMWDFDAEGAGEIMFNKVVNGFLPDLFKRWLKVSARHLVTIILFTRMRYDGHNSADQPDDTTNHSNFGSQSGRFRDYYRVVVSDTASGDWIKILYQLKKEFRTFLRDVSLVPRSTRHASSIDASNHENSEPQVIIAGKPSSAAQGNVLEAINLAAVQFAKDYIDRDLVRTGISVVVITAGTGVFEVDYNMLKLTTDTLVGSGIGIDLVCLSPMPLHSVPLFKYRNPRLISSLRAQATDRYEEQATADGFEEQDEKTPRQRQPIFGSMIRASPAPPPPIISSDLTPLLSNDTEDWRYAMPHWLDVSFWSGPSDEIVELSKLRKSDKIVKKSYKKGGTFALRCRMYELQMMGVMENELGDIAIPYMEEDPMFPHQLREHLEYPPSKLEETHKATRIMALEHGSYSSNQEQTRITDHSDRTKALYKDWMQAYDDNVFLPSVDQPGVPEQHSTRDERSETRRGSPEYPPKDPYLSTSFRSMSALYGKAALASVDAATETQSPKGSVYRHQDAKVNLMPLADVSYQMSSTRTKSFQRPSLHQRGGSGDSNDPRKSVYSTPNDSPAVSRGNSPPKRSALPLLSAPSPASSAKMDSGRPGGWFLRQISFGGRGGGASKSTASVAAIDITHGKVKPARLTVENNQKGAIAAKLASTKLTNLEKPSEPINIRAASRASMSSAHSPSTEHESQSVETVRGARSVRNTIPSHTGSITKDPGSTFLLAGSRALGESINPKLDLSSSGGAKDVPRTLSPTSAIAPWAVLVNPCNPKKNTINVANQFRRWQHVFPKRLRTSSVKWKSLCSPAAVPLTHEYFPTANQLATEYNESPYKITQNDEDEMLEAPKSRETLIRELIAFRLSHGFQIIVGTSVAEYSGGREQDLSSIFKSDYMSHDGDTVFMCVGNTIHQLVCLAGGEVEVKRFSRKPMTALQSSAGIDSPFPYKPFIRTAFEHDYRSRDVILQPPLKDLNWNFIDTFLAGYHEEEFSEALRFWRARFVLIPVDIPTVNRRPLSPLNEDSEEEIRLEGIRKLTQVWQRYRYIPPEERYFQATTKKQKDPNPLAIEYHTRDPSAIVAAGPDTALLPDIDSEFQTSLFLETDQYHTSSIDIKKLAEDLQGEKGIRMLDRRWHWRLHYNCFLGFDLTSWLLSNFKDVESRDDAVDLGNQLMNKGLFQHVQKRHQFRDGNFFYQIAAEYRAPRPESRTGWFGMRKTDRSVPSTPLSEGPKTSPLTGRSIRSRPSTGDSANVPDAEYDGEKTPTRTDTPKRKVNLSRVMRYDVDPRRRSYRPEIISLHYDRLHNPDNCYHIRIDWMNVTAKLIEDAIVTWATSVEKYGLKLVEVPITEASSIGESHPFRSPYIVKLAVQPPQAQPEATWDTSHFSPQHAKPDRFAYHKAILRKLNFVLDIEAANSFPNDVDVTYSWGSPDYKYTQFIHKSGTLIVQITDDGEFLVLANRLAHNRAKDGSKFRVTDPYEYKKATADKESNRMPTTPAERASSNRSPFSSPLARPVQDSALLHSAFQEPPMTLPPTVPLTQIPEQIKDEMEAFCSDAKLLRTFYSEAIKQAPSPSPRILPIPDSNIPNLGLPPAINIERASPANHPWSLSGSLIGGGPRGLGSNMGDFTVMTPSGIAGRRQGSEGSGNGKKASLEGSTESLPKRQDSQGSAGGGT
ncbi:hypothetical protein BDV95DRAFT_544516 [Massariosphaeria phaeospora]|uniref:Vacuolar membrane-associated protein IML1 n=1 Tax=Massariosphaeria phaeospora TaxID=100035 RepID=A0A7C8M675_9PLEO|nr:hypothetical protein BDV95DRAFT_544516 [Massariosphaeria phaeospora]